MFDAFHAVTMLTEKPAPIYPTGKHLILVYHKADSETGVPAFWYGHAFVDGKAYRQLLRDTQTGLESFRSTFGEPETVEIFESSREAHAKHPDHFL